MGCVSSKGKAMKDNECWHWSGLNGGLEVEALLEHTSLIDIKYLIALGEAGAIVPRCQDVPEIAKICKDNVLKLQTWPRTFSLPVLVLSYPWLDRDHPDPLGEQLRKLLPIFMCMLAVAQAGSRQGTVGVFWDYPCLPQKPFGTPDEKTQFDRGLRSLNEWYKHKYTHVLLLDDEAPSGADYTNTRPYSRRGWCKFERCISGITKEDDLLWSMTKYRGNEDYSKLCLMKSSRPPPVCPATFANEMRAGVESGELAFTASADMEMVIKKYEQGFCSAFSTKIGLNNVISYNYLGWKDEQIQVLIEACRYAVAHCTFPAGQIDIQVNMGNQMSKEMFDTLNDLNDFEFYGKFNFRGLFAEMKTMGGRFPSSVSSASQSSQEA